MGRRGEGSADADWDAEEEDDIDLDEEDDDFDDDEVPEDDVEDRSTRNVSRSRARKVAARRLIEQAREQRELHRALAEFDDELASHKIAGSL